MGRRAGWDWRAGIVLAVALWGVGAAAAAESPPESEGPIPVSVCLSPGRIVTILDGLQSGRTEEAESLLAAELAARPDDPYALLGRMKSSWWQIVSGVDPGGRLEARMRDDLESLESALRMRTERSGDDLEAAWILGEAHCTLGRLDGLRGRSWSTFRHHQAGVGLLERVREAAPTAPEPRSSIGLYRYYASRLPRSLRILGRIAGLRGDRDSGLADLRAAASAPGLQQVEAAFFRVQILQHEEDETLEALMLAQQWHARYPQSLGFTLLLADVLVGLERPDAAIQVLAEAAGAEAATRAHAALLAARIYADTGRPAAALAALGGIGDEERAAVTWIEPWTAVVRGTSLGLLGDERAARRELERAAGLADVAGSRNAAREALEGLGDPRAVALAQAESVLAWDGDPAAARAALERAIALRGVPPAGADAYLALGRLAIRQGDVHGAIAALRRAEAAPDDGLAALHVRPRIRLLQALLWSGQIDAARVEARDFASRRGRWGSNRQLELLVDGILHPDSAAVLLRVEARTAEGEAFRLKDVGFTAVDLVLPANRGFERVPMTWRSGYWEAMWPLGPGPHAYAFAIERRDLLVDPGARGVEVRDGRAWSVRWVPDSSSRPVQTGLRIDLDS